MSATSSHAAHVSWLTTRVAGMLDVDPADLDADLPLAEVGLSSLQAVELAGDLEDRLGRAVDPTVVYDHPTIAALADFAVST